MRFLIVAFMLLVSAPAVAEVAIQYPVSVPQQCFELAQREGVPTQIQNRYQAVKARLKLARLKQSDPMVAMCRAAIAAATTQAGGTGHYADE